MINNTFIQVQYDTDTEEFSCMIEYCEPKPGLHIYASTEGHGPTLADALRDLADQVAEQYESDEEEEGG